jgi:Carbohydrate esterase, sialic acid-specific acetylesterase/Secretion system C-terminal sorting domain
MKKLFIYLSLLFISNLALGQSITLPGSDGVVFQRKGVGQGADLELGINFNDSNLSSVQAYVEQYSVGNSNPNLYMNWTTYSCDAYPGVGGNYKRVKITLPSGLFRVQFRRTDNAGVITPPIRMGVGEVFYVAGQSNTTGVGSIAEPSPSSTYDNWVKFENNKEENLVYLANQSSTNCPDCSVPNSLCNQSFPKGKNGNDPSSGYKSHWRLFAEKLVNKLGVPVAIFQAGWADTSIEEWSTAADGNKVCKYYQNSVDGITTYPYYNLKYLFEARKYNGVRAILWHQGERDGANGTNGTAYSTYKSNLENLISKSRTHTKASMGVNINVPWVISQASISNGVSTKSGVTSAQNDVSQQLNNSLGPNTDNIANRFDGTHFNTNGLTDLANAWCDKIIDVNGSFRNTSAPIPAFGNSSVCPTVPNPPATPTVSITASCPTKATLSTSGCSGTITWYNSSANSIGTGTSITNTDPGSYTTTCTVGTCASGASGASVVPNNCPPPSGGGCYKLNIANYPDKRMGVIGSIVKVKTNNDTDNSQIWKFEDAGGGFQKISSISNSGLVLGTNGNNEIELQSANGGDAQAWQQYTDGTLTSNCSDCIGLVRKNSGTSGIGSAYGWGAGDSNPSVKDFKLASLGDVQTYGWNKWRITGVACPSTCTTLPNAPTISSPSNCNLSASGCTGTVTWSNGATGNSTTVSSSGPYTATCTVGTCISTNSNSVNVTCPTTTSHCPYTDASGWHHWNYFEMQWKVGNYFAWDAANSRILFAFNGPSGLYASFSNNPLNGALTRQQIADVGVPADIVGCFNNGFYRIASATTEPSQEINVFPNPTSGKVTVDFSLETAENVWLNLYNSQGRSMDLKDIEGKEGNNSIELDIKHYPAGTYFINLQSSQKREVKKVVKID